MHIIYIHLFFQPPSEREKSTITYNPPSPKGVTPAMTPCSSYHGSPETERRNPVMNGYSEENAMDIHRVTTQIEHAFPLDD